MPCRQCCTKVYGLVVLSADLVVSDVELDGAGMRTVLSEDWVVLGVGLDGPGMHVGWSCNDLFPMGNFICLCEGIFLTVVGISVTWVVVNQTSCGVGMSVPDPPVGDSICRYDESALTSAGEPSLSSVSSVELLPLVSSVLHSLLLGKGMDRLLHVITCGLPCNWLRATSL